MMKNSKKEKEPTENIEKVVANFEEQDELASVKGSANENAVETGSNAPSKTDRVQQRARNRNKKKRNGKSKWKIKCYSCNEYREVLCPYFPVCCKLKLMTSVQILAVIDIFVAVITISIWTYLYQYDPFIEKVEGDNTNYAVLTGFGAPPASGAVVPHKQVETFHESTTVLGPPLFGEDVDADSESRRYSKIAYVRSTFSQDIEQGCGQHYYVDYLFEHRLNVTRNLLYLVIKVNYFVELFYVFNAISILTATCCYFNYTSARTYLIVIWFLELVPVYMRLWLIVFSQSQRFCIFEYGYLRDGFKGLSFIFWLYLLPLILYRPYKILVLSCFIHSLFTSTGNLQLKKKIEEMTLKQYVAMQEGYLRMDKDRDKSSSADEENETIM
ncbi:unnamed protein product [Orchesella dallaii]|uniref:Transmembrane protein n=1 Tax=Orchesella dallaii TaxID=48710 RepID=A0ABP1QNT1_9HEXA